MDGYSVQEAASVLGVAEGRVWELLARGVLLGTPEGDSMRVFLKGQAGPIATPATREEPPRTNGNGDAHGAAPEASAFRELLTEFRNLTERYGQALLALGEARGEVAGLRSRVDLLEARLDLRLPEPVDAETVAWEPRPASMATPEAAPAPAPLRPTERFPKPKPNRRARRKPPTRSTRDAVAGFAAALERAQDPNPADLAEGEGEDELQSPVASAVEPASEETVDAVMALEGVALEDTLEATAEDDIADAVPEATAEAEALPEEVAAVEPSPEEAYAVTAESAPAEEIPVESAPHQEAASEPEPPTYSAVVVEPDWFADGDFAWLDAADVKPPGEEPAAGADVEMQAEAEPLAIEDAAPVELEVEPEAVPDEAGVPLAEPIRATEPEPEPEPADPLAVQQASPEAGPELALTDEPDPTAQVQAAFEPAVSFEPEIVFEPDATFEPEIAFETEVDFEPWQAPDPVAFEVISESPPAADTEPEPEPPRMSTAVAVEDLEEEEVMWLGGQPETAAVVRDEPAQPQRPDVDPWPAVDTVRPPLAMTEDELARLALDEGWDDAEVAAIRAMISPPQQGSVDLPGAAELHEAMAALEAVPIRSDPTFDPSRQWAKPASPSEEPPTYDDWGFESQPAAPPAPARNPLPRRDVTSLLRPPARDQGWLDRRRGPAADAYRRLRRLFPG